MTDQTALRKAIAHAIHRYDNQHALSGNDIPSEHHYGEADAVLAVLPAPVDQTAVLRAAGQIREDAALREAEGETELAQYGRELADLIAGDEAQPAPPRPRRGDAFEAWLKAQRDENPRSSHAWFMVDCVLDRYRLHADTGIPLDGHVCEAKVVGDCECLEQPATGAQQDGARP